MPSGHLRRCALAPGVGRDPYSASVNAAVARPDDKQNRMKVRLAFGLGLIGAALVAVPAAYLAVTAWSQLTLPGGDAGLGVLMAAILVVVMSGPTLVALALTPAGRRARLAAVFFASHVIVVIVVGMIWAALSAQTPTA